MPQSKLASTLPVAEMPLPPYEQHFYASDEQPQLTPEEIAADWELLRQYEAENGPILTTPLTTPIDPSQITIIHATPMPRRHSKREIPAMKARNTLESTRAFGQMRKSFFNRHLELRLRGGPDDEVGNSLQRV